MSASSSTTSRRAPRAVGTAAVSGGFGAVGGALLMKGPSCFALRSWRRLRRRRRRIGPREAALDGAQGFDAVVELVDAALAVAQLLRQLVAVVLDLALLGVARRQRAGQRLQRQ